ncbi:hypothetical protein GGQ21_002681 [Salinibacter ruber]|uniref:sulfotransferase family protein n=1 Tax=Salinibacter ruber TaxID=146919 RepID=UPI002074606F|nr:sulfotransferase [Salinibacter ruber]MCS3672011.1 hypothetical protein [Salinibacter ruber]
MSKDPIFVVGKHRSGTTWLSNLLLDHPEVAGIHHESHRGAHESAFFSHVDGRYGDLSVFENHVEFSAVMARTDYFRLAGVSFQDLLQLYPSSYAGIFRTVMGQVAERQSAQYWLEKTPMHTSHIRKIVEYYPNARFIGILRDPTDVAFSWLELQEWEQLSRLDRLLALARVTADKYVVDAHMLDVLSKQPEKLHIIRYEDLVNDKSEVLDGIYNFLSLPRLEVHSRYEANTSYTRSQTPKLTEATHEICKPERPSHEKKFVQYLYNWLLPLLPARALVRLKRLIGRKSKTSLPSWFFKLLNESLNVDGKE